MLDTFPRLLTLLRKEKGVSQKAAGEALGVSQALLSHYEKGIRECGLDFVVRAADYYGVSCDYLLGRTPDKTGAILTVDDIPEDPSLGAASRSRNVAVLNQRLVVNAVHVMFDLLKKSKNTALTEEAAAYLSLSVYALFRQLYQANPKNSRALFSEPAYLFLPHTFGSMEMALARFGRLASGHAVGGNNGLEQPPIILADELSKEYPLFASSLLNLLKNAEEYMVSKDKT